MIHLFIFPMLHASFAEVSKSSLQLAIICDLHAVIEV